MLECRTATAGSVVTNLVCHPIVWVLDRELEVFACTRPSSILDVMTDLAHPLRWYTIGALCHEAIPTLAIRKSRPDCPEDNRRSAQTGTGHPNFVGSSFG